MGRGKTGFVFFVEVTLKCLSFLMPASELACIFLVTDHLPVSVCVLGIVLALLGDVVFLTAVLTMRDNWRAGVSVEEKTELVTDGVYRISRNPAFLGFDLLYLGILLLFFHWALLLITLLTMLFFHLQIVNVEEEFLISAFGEEYLAYRKRVCRYFGRRSGK